MRQPAGSIAAFLVPLLAAAGVALGAESPSAGLAGRSLAEALQLLRDEGLAIVFTDEVVRPEMTVRQEPTAPTPRAVLDEILAAHGLAARDGGDGILVVVAAGVTSWTLRGRVLDGRDGTGLAGAELRILELARWVTTDGEGMFLFEDLPPGTYTLAAEASAHLEKRLRISPGLDERPVELRLEAGPTITDEIAVRPSRLALLEDSAESSFTLDREEIESLPHLGGDLFRATSLLPGVASNDVSAELSVHAGRADEVRILLDGQELYSAFHLQDYDNALSIVPATNLAAATLTTGALPASQGDRMSGVLDLRTVEPPDGRRTVLGLSVVDALVSTSGRFAEDRGSWMASARRGSLDLAGKAIGDERPRLWDVFTKAQRSTRFGLWGLRALAAADSLEVDRTEDDTFEHLETSYRSTYGWLSHATSAAAPWQVETQASWAGIRGDRDSTGSEEKGSWRLHDDRELTVLGLFQGWRFEARERHLAQWGWEVRRYEAFFDYSKSIDPDIVILAPFSPPRVFANDFRDTLVGRHLGIWASDRIALGDRLTLELGARWDRHSATGDTLWSPRASAARRLGESTVLRAAWGRFFQSQRPYELQVADAETSLHRAERSEHWVLGWERLFPEARWGVEAVRLELYRRRIDDPRPRYESLLEPLNFFPEIEPDRVRVAPRSSTAEGLELLVRGRERSRLRWWLAYARARSQDRLGAREVPRELDQPHTLTVDVGYRLPAGWLLNLAWRYHTGWPTTPVVTQLVVDPEEPDEEPELIAVFGPLRSRRLPAYHRLDLRTSRTWNRPSGRLTFFVDVQNLYDRSNRAGFDFVIDEDDGTATLDPEDWPGIFPSLGVQWTF
ncbi:MAG: TonB-dependent receptor [Thermoanaerobaculia bacterium]